jgi:hypothetical protein
MSVEDKFKEAADSFLKAAWIFEKIKLETGNLKTPDFGIDFSEQNLLMCTYIMKAQAQYCAFEKVKRKKPDGYQLLSKLAMQASVLYGKAYSIASTPPVCKSADPKNFIAILQFNEYTFIAQAYNWMSLYWEKFAEDKGEGMGNALVNIRKACEYLSILRNMEKQLSPAVMTIYKDLITHYCDKRNYLEGQNNKIYHETVPAKPEEIECQSFGSPISIETELSKPFEGQEVFAKLVPPAVMILEEEYKTEIASIMSLGYQKVQECDHKEREFLASHNLPSCLHAVSGEQVLPEDLWEKVKLCKEKGGVKSLEQMINGVNGLSENNSGLIEMLRKQLKEEEEEDASMRTNYGPAWNRPPSANLTPQMKKQLEYYNEKLNQGKKTDVATQEKLNIKKEYLNMLESDKQALSAGIPKSQRSQGELSPSAARYL